MISSGVSIQFMNHGAWYRFFSGYLDDVRFYNRALTAKDIAALYDSEK